MGNTKNLGELAYRLDCATAIVGALAELAQISKSPENHTEALSGAYFFLQDIADRLTEAIDEGYTDEETDA